MQGPRREKRKRGGQPGNRNARTHGFYAAGLTPEELDALWYAVNVEGGNVEVAAVRIKLQAALRQAALGPRLRRDAARRLARLYRARFQMDEETCAAFRKLVLRLLEAAAADETDRSQTPEKGPEVTKRIEAENGPRVAFPALEKAL